MKCADYPDIIPRDLERAAGTCRSCWCLPSSSLCVDLSGSCMQTHHMTTGFSFRSEQTERSVNSWKRFDWPSRKHKHASWGSLLLSQHKQFWTYVFICQNVFNTLLWNMSLGKSWLHSIHMINYLLNFIFMNIHFQKAFIVLIKNTTLISLSLSLSHTHTHTHTHIQNKK